MSLGGEAMWRRKTTGVVAIVAGVVLFVAGLADHAFAAPKAALCQSGIGQFVQDMDGTLAHDCGLVTALEAATGWLLIAGVLIAVLGAAVIVNARAAVTRPAGPVGPAVPPAGPAAPDSWWSRT
jgi:drug/metabolite transporter (DMT)-like permease